MPDGRWRVRRWRRHPVSGSLRSEEAWDGSEEKGGRDEEGEEEVGNPLATRRVEEVDHGGVLG